MPKSIVDEIIEINPSLQKDKDKLESFISLLSKSDPKLKVPGDFKCTLKSKLYAIDGTSNTIFKFNFFSFFIPVFSLIFVVGAGFYTYKDFNFLDQSNLNFDNHQILDSHVINDNETFNTDSNIKENQDLGNFVDKKLDNNSLQNNENKNVIIDNVDIQNQNRQSVSNENNTEIVNRENLYKVDYGDQQSDYDLIHTENNAKDFIDSSSIDTQKNNDQIIDTSSINEPYVDNQIIDLIGDPTISNNYELSDSESDFTIDSVGDVEFSPLIIDLNNEEYFNTNEFEEYCSDNLGTLSGSICVMQNKKCSKTDYLNGICILDSKK